MVAVPSTRTGLTRGRSCDRLNASTPGSCSRSRRRRRLDQAYRHRTPHEFGGAGNTQLAYDVHAMNFHCSRGPTEQLGNLLARLSGYDLRKHELFGFSQGAIGVKTLHLPTGKRLLDRSVPPLSTGGPLDALAGAGLHGSNGCMYVVGVDYRDAEYQRVRTARLHQEIEAHFGLTFQIHRQETARTTVKSTEAIVQGIETVYGDMKFLKEEAPERLNRLAFPENTNILPERTSHTRL